MLRGKHPLATAALLALATACGGDHRAPEAPPAEVPATRQVSATKGGGLRIPAEPQRDGDPDEGYRALVNENYIGCGIPVSIYQRVFGSWPAQYRLPGRTGRNAELPYFLTAYTSASGVEVVTANCLSCHAAFLRGDLVIGLGDSSLDFSINPSPPLELAGVLLGDADERAEWRLFADRVRAIAPYLMTETLGANPGDAIAAALFAHRDPKTLAWSDEPLMDLPALESAPLDVPPWWRMKHKHAMFYTAAGRGDHARIMMTASALCTDTVERAREIDAMFPDIRAYISSLEPPAWPFGVDAALAAEGQDVFETHCQRCHGSYGDDASYPNLVVALDEIGTDRTLADGAGQFAGPFVEWFNASFYGEIARLEPAPGYIAPPLDGVWATAPYLHNGSVPTIAALLDSKSRPPVWTRSFRSSDYDPDALGWTFQTVDAGDRAGTRAVRIIDTTRPGYSNAGHTFGDELTAAERAAVLEYVKTL
jgi:mono/diheme cytochrome c family protein